MKTLTREEVIKFIENTINELDNQGLQDLVQSLGLEVQIEEKNHDTN